MSETETKGLIIQAARELQLEGLTVEASLSKVGFYNVKWSETKEFDAEIPMGAEFKSIIDELKTSLKK